MSVIVTEGYKRENCNRRSQSSDASFAAPASSRRRLWTSSFLCASVFQLDKAWPDDGVRQVVDFDWIPPEM
jgi:hypothetical protein